MHHKLISFIYLDDIQVGIAVRGVQPSYARELDISKDIPHVNILIQIADKEQTLTWIIIINRDFMKP